MYSKALEGLCAENDIDIPDSLVKDMKFEMKQSKKKNKSISQSPVGFTSQKMKEKLEIELENQKKIFEKQQDDLQLKCNVLLQENKELNIAMDLKTKEIANLEAGFKEYMQNQENLDQSIMKVNPNDESMINKSMMSIFDGQEIKNSNDFENFLANLNLSPNDMEAVNRYWNKQKKRMDKESRWINKLKRIINELLGNYQKLIEKELPDLQDHHDTVLESLKENERKHIIAFNDKILGILNQFFNKNEKLEDELRKKNRRERELVTEMQMKEEQNKLILKGMKKKLDTLKKCMNLCFQKFKELKSEAKAAPNVQYRVDLKGFDSFSSHLMSMDNNKSTANAFNNAMGNQRILKFVKGKKKT